MFFGVGRKPCAFLPIPKRYRYKPTPFKNYFKLIDPIITSEQWIITVKPPTRIFLTELDIYGVESTDDPTYCNPSIPNYQIIKEHFLKEGRLSVNAALRVIRGAIDIFEMEPNVLKLSKPITFVGDVGGQYYDLLTLLKIGGKLDRFIYLFLGDYVNGGYFGTEIVIHLCAMKINFPDKIYLLRGNNDTRNACDFDIFKIECELKYNIEFYDECMKLFDNLPIVAIVNDRFYCAHGGISPYIYTIKDIASLNRFSEPAINSPIFNILWSDPIPNYSTYNAELFAYNNERGGSYYYSYCALQLFLKNNNLDGLIRGHDMCYDGFKCYLRSHNSSTPSIISITSSPNIGEIYGNKGAIIQYEYNTFVIKQFASVPHPFWYRNYECAIVLTLPFIAEKVTDILLALLMNCVEGGTEDMYMPNMKQSRSNQICYKNSKEYDKILDMKKLIRLVCKISQFYRDKKNEKLSYAKLLTKNKKCYDGELKVMDKNEIKLIPNMSISKINIIDENPDVKSKCKKDVKPVKNVNIIDEKNLDENRDDKKKCNKKK